MTHGFEVPHKSSLAAVWLDLQLVIFLLDRVMCVFSLASQGLTLLHRYSCRGAL